MAHSQIDCRIDGEGRVEERTRDVDDMRAGRERHENQIEAVSHGFTRAPGTPRTLFGGAAKVKFGDGDL